MVNIDKNIRFNDVIGLKDVKEILEERLRVYLKYKNQVDGASKGILLYGYPGCGKTMVVVAAMNDLDEKKVLCKIVDTGDLTAHVGTTTQKVKEYFMNIRIEAKGRDIVLLMDEADEILPIKGDKSVIANERVAALLRELDGIENTNKDIFIIATTNHPIKIEPAMLRSGRIDYHIRVKEPTDNERQELINKYLKDIPGCEPVLGYICVYTPKWTGADYNRLRHELQLKYLIGKEKDVKYQLDTKTIVDVIDRIGRLRKTNFKKFEAEYNKYQNVEDDFD